MFARGAHSGVSRPTPRYARRVCWRPFRAVPARHAVLRCSPINGGQRRAETHVARGRPSRRSSPPQTRPYRRRTDDGGTSGSLRTLSVSPSCESISAVVSEREPESSTEEPTFRFSSGRTSTNGVAVRPKVLDVFPGVLRRRPDPTHVVERGGLPSLGVRSPSESPRRPGRPTTSVWLPYHWCPRHCPLITARRPYIN